NESRVGLTTAGVHAIVERGHTVKVEKNAGTGSYFYDSDYVDAEAEIAETAAAARDAYMLVKVEQPLSGEFGYFKENLILFTYLHLAPEIELTKALLEKNVVSIAYETIQAPDGSLPLLSPMSEVAGRMATQIGAEYLQKINGGKGILLSGVPGVSRGKVTIIGGGMAGTNAAKMAIGL